MVYLSFSVLNNPVISVEMNWDILKKADFISGAKVQTKTFVTFS